MIKELMNKQTAGQLGRFALVGLSNTLLTLAVIFILTKLFSVNYVIANGIGYTVGVINSFVLNKIFTFNSRKRSLKEVILFLIVHFTCYFIQLGTLVLLKNTFKVHGDLSQFLAMGVYTTLNFLLNKFVTFQTKG